MVHVTIFDGNGTTPQRVEIVRVVARLQFFNLSLHPYTLFIVSDDCYPHTTMKSFLAPLAFVTVLASSVLAQVTVNTP